MIREEDKANAGANGVLMSALAACGCPDLHMLVLGGLATTPREGVLPERAARELGIDVAVVERLFADLERAGFIASD